MMTKVEVCSDCAVRDRALCGSLSHSELTALNGLGRRQHLSRGDTLIWAGDDAIVCGNVISGVLKLASTTTDGREAIVGLLYPGDFVGSPYSGRADVTVSALDDVEMCVFPRQAFERLLADHAAMERLLLQRTLAALDEARGRMLMLGRMTAGERVAGFLTDMAARAEASGCRAHAGSPVTFDLPLTRGQIADVLGLTIETVSRQMTRLKAEGVIALPGGRAITVMNMANLTARAAA